MADRDIANRQLARMNAVEPIAVVILAFVQMHVGIGERLVAEFPGFTSRTSRLTMDRAVRALERRAALLALSANQS